MSSPFSTDESSDSEYEYIDCTKMSKIAVMQVVQHCRMANKNLFQRRQENEDEDAECAYCGNEVENPNYCECSVDQSDQYCQNCIAHCESCFQTGCPMCGVIEICIICHDTLCIECMASDDCICPSCKDQ